MFTGGVIDPWTEQVQAAYPSTRLQYPYVSPNLDPAWEVQENLVKNISPYMPYEMYRQTNYTVICETLGTSDTFFFSEKTTKPLLGRRLFVMFGAVDFLKNLRNLGFKTFNRVIDESYDSIKNHVLRFDAAFQQVQWLSEQDPREIYSQIQGELEHNCHLVQTLQHKTLQQMHDLLRTKIPKLD
jgi:hypothetical protein